MTDGSPPTQPAMSTAMSSSVPGGANRKKPAMISHPIAFSRFSIHALSDRHRMLNSILILGAVVPVCFTAVSIAIFSVNSPWLEEWEHVRWFQKLADNKLSLRDLFAQQNEYRQFFPNLVFVLLGSLSKGDVRFSMLASFLLACLVSFNIYRLARPRLDTAPTHSRAAYLLANVLIFSPIQYENWLQGQQLIFFVPIACLSACLLIALSETLATATRFAFCALLCTISTFSSANGVVCWLVVLPALVRPLSLEGLRAATWWIAAWLAALALNLTVYLYGYQTPSHHPALSVVVTQPLTAAVYFFTALGGGLGFGKRWLAALIGAILLAAFGWACVQSWRQRRDQQQLARMSGWLIIGAYSILTALLITIGRAGFGSHQALDSRYTTFTLYLLLSLVFVIPICLDARARDIGRQPGRLRIVRPRALLAVVLVVYHAPIYLLGIGQMSNWQVRTLASKACVLLVNVVKDECALLATYHSNFDSSREHANALGRLGFLEAPIVTSDKVRDIAFVSTTPSASYGSFTSLVHQEGDEYVAAGKAILHHRGEPAHLVLLAYQDVDGQERVFAVSGMPTYTAVYSDVVSAIVSAALGRAQYRDARWQKSFRSRELPAGSIRLTAWAFDAYTGKAYGLEGDHVLYNNAASQQRSP